MEWLTNPIPLLLFCNAASGAIKVCYASVDASSRRHFQHQRLLDGVIRICARERCQPDARICVSILRGDVGMRRGLPAVQGDGYGAAAPTTA